MAIVGFDPLVLLNYYAARQPLGSSPAAAHARIPSKAIPPWDLSVKRPSQESRDVSARGRDPYFDPKDASLLAKANGAANAGSQLEAILASTLSQRSAAAGANPGLADDNNKLFALYKALDRLEYIARMANREGSVDGLRPGLDRDFQNGLSQVLSFVKTTEFANLAVMAGQKTSTAQAGVAIAYPKSEYIGGAVAKDDAVFQPLAGVSASDRFTISVIKSGVTTDVLIDLANVSGPLTIDNIDAYVNGELQAAGFGTRFSRVQTGGSVAEGTATWGIKIATLPAETVKLSSDAATPSLYVAGASGKTAGQQGKLIKLVDLSSTPASAFSAAVVPDSGTASAKAAAVDAEGNVYVVGDSSGSFGNELNQGSQDVFLSKFDSAGNLQWTKLLGSAGTAGAYGLAVDPSSGGVVIAGSVTGDLSPDSIGGGSDSFVAKYDREGNQTWVRQVAPLSNDRANSVAVDAEGNIYLGGQTEGSIGSGQTNMGGTDAYIAKLDKTGAVLYERQFGTAGSDYAMRTAIAEDGNLVVASIQNGHAILTKYGSAGGTSAAIWRIDLGDLQGGAIGGLAVADGRVYLSGTSANAALDAGGAAPVAQPNSGGTDAFVFAAVDAGASASADFVSYVGTGASEQGGGIVAANGKLYLTGTTTGTFAGETRNEAGTHNLFVAELGAGGTLDWTRQYGGLDGESLGLSIAADATGSSVLDALKLPRGTIDTGRSNAIAAQTTVRAGDYFSLQIQGKSSTRSAKIVIAKGETLRSLALKINNALLFDGKASTLGVKGGQGLKIAVNEGVQVQLIAGPKDFDALAGLGLKPQTLIDDGSAKSNGAATDASPDIVGLGINGGLDLLSRNNASHAHIVLQGALSLIKQAYANLNGSRQSGALQAAGPAPAYLQSQIAGYRTALAWLNSIG